MEENFCRTCGTQQSELITIEAVDPELLETLGNLTRLKVELFESTSDGFCLECVEFLCKCKDFKDKCLETQERINYKISQNDSYVMSIKTEDDDFFNLNSHQEALAAEDGVNFEVKTELSELEDENQTVQSNIKSKRKRKISESKSKAMKSSKNLLNDADTGESRKTKNPTLCCEICGKFLIGSGSLKKHMMSHLGIKEFHCEICSKNFITKWKLQEHMNRHMNIKKFSCDQCGLKKTTMHELKVHINYHTKEKLYKCDYCELTFTSMGNRGRHMKVVHLGIKAFVCRFCSQSFGKKETLKHHEMRHTGEKNHVCEICNKKFIQLVALRTHMKTHNRHMTATSSIEIQPQ